MEHPGDDALLRFLLGKTSRDENRQIVRHLLTRCPVCAAALEKMWKEPPGQPISPAKYDPALDRFEVQLRAWWTTHPKSSQPNLLSKL